MTKYTGVYNRPSYKRGDTVPEMSVTLVDKETESPIIPLSVRSQLRDFRDNMLFDFPISISTTTGRVSLGEIPPEVTRTFPNGAYKYDIEYTLAGGRVVTYLEGVLKIEGDVTR